MKTVDKRKSLSKAINMIVPNLQGEKKRAHTHYLIAVSFLIFCFFLFGMVEFFQILLTVTNLTEYLLWVSIAPGVGMLICVFFAIRSKRKEKIIQNIFQIIELINSKKKITIEKLNINASDEEVKAFIKKLIETENLQGYVLQGNTIIRSK